MAPYINSRLQTVGYKGNELFDFGSVQKTALYSKGIPRLINVICDNALLIAYATSQSKVSAKIIDEVARDLRLTEPPPQVKAAEERKPTSRQAGYDDERSEAEEFPAALKHSLRQPQDKRSWAGVTIAVGLAVIVLAGTVLYSQQSGSLAAFGVNIDDLVGVRWNPPYSQAPDNINQDNIAQSHMPHLQVTASRPSEFLTDNPSGDGITGPARKDSGNSEPSSANIEIQSPKSGNPLANSLEPNPTQTDAKAKPKERTYRVFDASFVRDKPRSDANITGMLEPGTRIKIQSKTGDYFRVRSLDRDPISGYVHREDAFFEPTK